MVRAWFMPPRTTVRALLKYPGISVCTCRIAHSCNTSRSSWPSVTGTAVGRGADSFERREVAVVQPGGPGLADAGHRDGVSRLRPLPDQPLGGPHVAPGPDPHEPEVVVEEGHVLVVVRPPG